VGNVAGLDRQGRQERISPFFDPDGNYVVRYPATPSNPRRRRLDVLNAVKKAGLPWPTPSKKEQRAKRNKENP
jgi:hypothetical protein